jgi:UDP-N-acetylglucosamine 3-dehydrogenase
VLGIAELNWILPRGFPAAGHHRLDLVGSAGSLSIATIETGLRRADGQRAVLLDTASAPSVQGHPGGMFYFELRHFVDCVRGRATPAVTPNDVIQALRIAQAVERAATTGLPVAP